MPPIGDGTVEVPFPIDGEDEMAEDVKTSLPTVVEQNFVDHHQRLRMIAERTQDSAGFIKSRAEEQFLNESRLVGALAAGRLEKDQLASAILQQRSARDQPHAPGT